VVRSTLYFLARESILGYSTDSISSFAVIGYDPLLSPQFLQTEIPAVSHFSFFFLPFRFPAFTFAKAKN